MGGRNFGVTHITMPCPWVFDRNYAALLAQMEYLSFVDVRRLAWVRPKAQSATGSMAIPSLVWNCCGGSASTWHLPDQQRATS